MDRWVDLQKAKINEEATAYKRKLNEEQQEIDDLVEKILRAQSERGLRSNPDGDENETANIMNKKSLLEIQKREIELNINRLKSECGNRKKIVEGIKSWSLTVSKRPVGTSALHLLAYALAPQKYHSKQRSSVFVQKRRVT